MADVVSVLAFFVALDLEVYIGWRILVATGDFVAVVAKVAETAADTRTDEAID